MKTSKKVLIFVLVLAMLSMCFAGCATAPSEESPGQSTPADTSSTTPSEDGQEPAESGDSDLHEIYQLAASGATELSGIISPDTQSRADVDKAWPMEDDGDGVLTIGWTEINQDNDWFVGVRLAAEAKAKEYGFELIFMNADNDVTKQSEHIDTFITQGVDIIVVDPVNQTGPVQDINRAVEAGIPVVCIGTVPEDCKALTTIAFANFFCGWEAGLYIGTQFEADETINAALMPGKLGNTTAESRVTGAVAGVLYSRMEALGTPYACEEDAWLDAYNIFESVRNSGKATFDEAKFNVVGYGEGDWTIEGGLNAAEDIITANAGSLNLFLPDNDFEAVGCITAIENAGYTTDEIKVGTSADGTLEGINLVGEGKLLCTGTMSGPQVGAGGIEFINDIVNNGFDPNDLLIGSFFTPTCITADNYTDYLNDDPTGFDGKFYKTPEWNGVQTYSEWKEEQEANSN